MLAVFCLRLAWGMILSLLLLNPAQVAPRYYRVHFLTALGLVSVAAFFLREMADTWLWVALASSFLLCFLGSAVWHVDGAPLGKTVLGLSCVALTAALIGQMFLIAGSESGQPGMFAPRLADDLAGGLVLGTATSAMLMGHSYLIAPAMSLAPLMRLLAGMAAALVVRIALAGWGLWLWTEQFSSANLETETMLWLPVRWLLGLVGPIVLGWMAWETARIRSTQSATGILYVVVIVCFLGELTSQLLTEKTGFLL